eukprot:288805-Pelagomonas_calceolata.AAC.2
MSGKLEEDEAVDRLSQLHCRMQLLASPAHAQHAATQNGNVSEQLKQAQLGGSNRRRTVPEEGASDDTDGQQQREAQQQQQQQPSQRRLAGSTSFTAPPAGIHDFTPSFGGYYSQVLRLCCGGAPLVVAVVLNAVATALLLQLHSKTA